MIENIKKAWVGALRSGEFAEGRFALRDKDDRYCALGVLCHIFGFMENVQWKFDKSFQMHYLHTHTTANGSVVPDCGFPSKEILDWAGITVQDAIRISNLHMRGASFNEITNHLTFL